MSDSRTSSSGLESEGRAPTENLDPRDVEAVMAAARVLVGVSARSVAAVEHIVTLPQLRVLVIAASQGPMNLGTVAKCLGVHPSNATRIAERLVTGDLMSREEDPTDRRHSVLRLTDAGIGLVNTVMDHRRAAITSVLEAMPAARRRSLVPALRAFAAAGQGLDESDRAAWSLGWTS